MNIVFFTPVNIHSSIANISAIITRSLIEQGHEVAVFSAEKEDVTDKHKLDFGVPQHHWHDTFAFVHHIEWADICVYQIADNIDEHYGALYRLHFTPGLVCLHGSDFTQLGHGWIQNHPSDAQALFQTWVHDTSVNNDFSFTTEWICSLADGVITHNGCDLDTLQRATCGPAVCLAILDSEWHVYTQTLLQIIQNILQTKPMLDALSHFGNILQGWSAPPELLQHPSVSAPLNIFNAKGLLPL